MLIVYISKLKHKSSDLNLFAFEIFVIESIFFAFFPIVGQTAKNKSTDLIIGHLSRFRVDHFVDRIVGKSDARSIVCIAPP